MPGDCLVILPPLKACFEDGRVVLTRKFVEGRQAASGSSAGFRVECSRAPILSRSRARSAAVNFQLNGRAVWL